MTMDLNDYTIIKEGDAELLMQAKNGIFYNKTQVLGSNFLCSSRRKGDILFGHAINAFDNQRQAIIGPSGRSRGRGSRAMNQGRNAKILGAALGGQGHIGVNQPVGDLIAARDELAVQKSADKLAAADDEGSTSPLPERLQIANSPVYKLDRKLGREGFGQVYVGRRVSGGIGGTGRNAMRFHA